MATKALLLLLLSFVLFILLSETVLAHLDDHDHQNQSPFEFLKHLQGCHKGERVKDINKLKKYLQKFGYLTYTNSKNESRTEDDDFDDFVESAIKTYQINYHLNATGVLDSNTVSKMMMSRCGVADIVNGTNSMRAGQKRHHSLHSVSHYTFFRGEPKWPNSKYHLTYGFPPGVPGNAVAPVTRAFRTWAANTHFQFTRTQDVRNADLKISFHRRAHGDGNDFDGRGGVIAHAFAPQDGRFHYDGDENWAVGAVNNAFDLETVALHEIGHLLGLGHSSVEGAIMFPTITPGRTKGLHRDDINGIRDLYNIA